MLEHQIRQLASTLRLSSGDLLGLSREVAQNGALRSPGDLTAAQRRCLVDLLEFLAAPCEIAFPLAS